MTTPSDARLAGCRDALGHVHPLCNPWLGGPADLKREWRIGRHVQRRFIARQADDLVEVAGSMRKAAELLNRKPVEMPA